MGLPKLRLSQLKYYHFVDSDDQEMGSLEDLILHAQNLSPTHILLGGGFFEEYLESKGEIDDIDELAPITAIEAIEDDYVVLSKKLKELPTTTNDGNLPMNGIKFSELIHFKVSDPNGETSAELFDFILNGSKSRIIFNYPKIGEKLLPEGYQQRFEVSFDTNDISQQEKTLVLPVTFEEILEFTRQTIKPKMRGKSLVNYK